MKLKQFVPAEYCRKCDTCCRFLDEETPLAPTDIPLVNYRDRFICKNFDPAANKCKDYENRPLDCKLYPFVLMYDKNYTNIVLGVDPKCPYAQIPCLAGRQAKYKDYLVPILKDIEPKYISRFQDDVIILKKLDNLAREISKRPPALRRLLISDKGEFEKYALQAGNPLSSYSFIYNYIWTGLLNYYWAIIDNNFCLFCQSAGSVFMPIPPLGKTLKKKTIKECFRLMDGLNKNKGSSRIEDIPDNKLKFFKDMGYKVKEKSREYLCRQSDLANLSGDKYKAKRALYNYFVKNYKAEYRKFTAEDKEGCISLYNHWAKNRAGAHKDGYYNALIEDSYLAHKKAMERYADLGLAGGLVGRAAAVDNKICAYTFGYPLNKETFVILFEITDLNIKGLAQFIFRKFCNEMHKFKYINLMDDSGLENLRKVKVSYHPVKIERTSCAYA